MLLQLYPKVHRRYTSSPVLGSIVEGFGAWLLKESETCLYPVRPLGRIEQRVATYATYLGQVRGLVASTVAAHCCTATALLADIEYESNRLCALTAMEVKALSVVTECE